jgi:hypothetical protein
MTAEIVRFNWGPFLRSCHISLMDGEKFGPTLQISGEQSDSAAKILQGLSNLSENTDYPLTTIQPYLPPKSDITWEERLSGDDILGFAIRGRGPNYRVWMEFGGGGSEPKLNDAQKMERYEMLCSAIGIFFP